MVSTFIDKASPRYRLPFAELPRGVIKFPEHIVTVVEALAVHHDYGEEYKRQSLIHNTLYWFYAGLPTAYRELPDGIEVLALGWEETAAYKREPMDGVKVVQP